MCMDRWRVGLFQSMAFGFAMLLSVVAARDNALAQKTVTTIDPALLAAAHDLVEASGGAEEALKELETMADAMQAQLQKGSPAADTDMVRFLQKYYLVNNPKLKAFLKATIDIQTRYYATHFTIDEMKEATAFQKSAVGRKLRKLMRDMTKSLMPLASTFSQTFIMDMMAKMHAEQAERN